MNKKIIAVIAFVVIVVGIAVTAMLGVNSDLIYRTHKELDINIGKEFNIKDIEDIVKEITGGKEVIISKIELYKDMANIKIEDVTTEQIEQINTKINEKYIIDNKVEDIIITEVPKVNEFDLLKPYIVPTLISIALITAYFIGYLLVCNKNSKDNEQISIPKSLLGFLALVIGTELLLFSTLAIIRFPINGFVLPVAVILFVITSMTMFIKK